MITDVHTHNLEARHAIISVEPGFTDFRPETWYSMGIHPWHTPETSPELIAQLDAEAVNPQVVAIGEAGLDRLKGGPLEEQIKLLEHHVELSERLEKPLIIHCVRAWSELLAVRKRMKPRQAWIVHGFRGNERLLKQLIAAGLYVSVDPSLPTVYESVGRLSGAVTGRILVETDEAPVSLLPQAFPAETELARELFRTSRTPDGK